MRLPNGDQALVPLERARVFAAALGITAAEAEVLRQAILQAAATGDAVVAERDAYGQRFVLDFEMAGPMGDVTVRSLWIVRTGETTPRMTSCFVL